MKRQVSLDEISDGKLYRDHDMVKADCGGCKGCSDCCRGMGDSVLLDPYDLYRLAGGLKVLPASLLENQLALGVVDGYILPHLNMNREGEQCAFLNEEGRCSVHPFRPGICRLFPLGRYYENGSYSYFLQIHECTRPHSKIKVSKWIDTPDGARYRQFITQWHYFLNQVEETLKEIQSDEQRNELNVDLLKLFYLLPYEEHRDFYEQFAERKEQFLCIHPLKSQEVL